MELKRRAHSHRENLRRRFGLVLRNAEHVDSRSSQEAEDYRSSRGYVAGERLFAFFSIF